MQSTRHHLTLAYYLERLGVGPFPTIDLATLEILQTNHIQTFTHDTIDSCLKRPISLSPQKIIEKFLAEKRGGLCIELNGAFCYLLQHLGFDATLLSSNVKHVEKRPFDFTIDTHAVIKVNLSNILHLVDVGFADSFRKPIPFDGSFEDISGKYRVSRVTQDVHGLYKFIDDEWLLQYTFSTAPRQLSDFQANLRFVCHSPQHDFSHSLICTRSTASGHIVLLRIQDEKAVKKQLIIKDANTRFVTTYESFDDIKSILIEHFGMDEQFVRSLKEPVLHKKTNLEYHCVFKNAQNNKKKHSNKNGAVIEPFSDDMLSSAFCQGSDTAKKLKRSRT